jgi:hypothetical protein
VTATVRSMNRLSVTGSSVLTSTVTPLWPVHPASSMKSTTSAARGLSGIVIDTCLFAQQSRRSPCMPRSRAGSPPQTKFVLQPQDVKISSARCV